jgi:cation diffusion facilitator CzcD-associated flavoprotein CzcO
MGSISVSSLQDTYPQLDYDVLIIGSGLSGIYSLYRIRQLGLRVKVLETGSGEGGTWYWYALTHLLMVQYILTQTS